MKTFRVGNEADANKIYAEMEKIGYKLASASDIRGIVRLTFLPASAFTEPQPTGGSDA